jgi:hypothetical protein
MNLASEVKNIRENNTVSDRYASIVRVTEKYNSLVSRGLIKEEGHKTALPGEINGYYAYRQTKC